MSADIYLLTEHCCSSHDHNVTHNLAPMFRAAGLDWHDYRNEKVTAAELMREVSSALTLMVNQPEKFKALNPSNGWGDYDGALAFLARLVVDCARHPEAIVEVSL